MATARVHVDTYHVTAPAIEGLLQVLKPLGEAIQHSAQKGEAITFSKQSLKNFGEALQHVESEVSRQRMIGEASFWQKP